MSANAKFSKILLAGAVASLLCSAARADGILYSLPETSGSGVNNTGETGGQTNVSYNACQNDLCGSMLGGDVTNISSLNWDVTTLTVWAVDNENLTGPTASTDTPTLPSSIASGLLLVGGDGSSGYGSAMSVVSSSYTVTAAPYSGSSNGTNYLSPAGGYDGVWQLTFNVTGLTIGVGETYAFAVGDSVGNLNNDSSLLALNATLCNGYTDYVVASPCQSDGIVAIGGGQINGYYNYADTGINGYPGPDALISADVDVSLTGSATPEPTTLLLFGLGAGMLGLVRRRRG